MFPAKAFSAIKRQQIQSSSIPDRTRNCLMDRPLKDVQMIDDREQKTDDRRQMTEDRRQMTDDREQKTDNSNKSDDITY
jgi:hypothetical protein